MRYFVRKSVKGGRSSVSNQHYKSAISDEVIIIISKKLDINCNICDISEKFFVYENKHRKMVETKNDSQFKGYRDNNENARTKNTNDILSKLPKHNI